MSTAASHAFLTKLHQELSVSSGDYRQFVVDLRWHTFKVSRANIKAQTMIEFKHRNITPNAEQVTAIDDAASKCYRVILDEIKVIKASPEVDIDRNTTYMNNERLRLVFTTFGERIEKVHRAQLDPSITFDRIKKVYKLALGAYFKDLQLITDNAIRKHNASKKTGKFGKESKVGNFFHLGHLAGMGVAETQLRDGLATAFASVPLHEHGNITNMLSHFGIDLSYKRMDDKDSMEVKIESKGSNLSAGGFTGNQKKNLLKALRQALTNRMDLMLQPGSDTPKMRKEKQVQKSLEDPFRSVASKRKNIKIKGKKVKLKKSKSKAVVKTITQKKSKGTEKLSVGKLPKVAVTKRRKDNNPASSPLHMIVAINKKLPHVVAQNMQSPALEYQTGRFAASVRVTDVVTTPKGYPSIGYTYDKFPYQTFEEGYAQGSGERDPRKLINRSIREIAAEMAIGRFFTRRV